MISYTTGSLLRSALPQDNVAAESFLVEQTVMSCQRIGFCGTSTDSLGDNCAYKFWKGSSFSRVPSIIDRGAQDLWVYVYEKRM